MSRTATNSYAWVLLVNSQPVLLFFLPRLSVSIIFCQKKEFPAANYGLGLKIFLIPGFFSQFATVQFATYLSQNIKVLAVSCQSRLCWNAMFSGNLIGQFRTVWLVWSAWFTFCPLLFSFLAYMFQLLYPHNYKSSCFIKTSPAHCRETHLIAGRRLSKLSPSP